MRTAFTYSVFFFPSFIFLAIRDGITAWSRQTGLSASPVRGFIAAFFFALPMMAGYSFTGIPRLEISPEGAVLAALLPGFFEEYLFRGFLFRQLFRQVKLGFVPAVLISALLFGLGHLAQGNTLSATAGVVLLTALGGAWFAWLMTEWDDNLWLPVFLHMLMNLSWYLFETGEDARGTLYANLFRVLTIVVSVAATLRMAKNRGHFRLVRKNLFS